MIPPADTTRRVWPWISIVMSCSILPPFMANSPFALPEEPRSMLTVPEPALTMASVMRVASSAPSTESPALRDGAEELELLLELLEEPDEVEAAGDPESELPQPLRPRAAASATAAIEVVFMRRPAGCVARRVVAAAGGAHAWHGAGPSRNACSSTITASARKEPATPRG